MAFAPSTFLLPAQNAHHAALFHRFCSPTRASPARVQHCPPRYCRVAMHQFNTADEHLAPDVHADLSIQTFRSPGDHVHEAHASIENLPSMEGDGNDGIASGGGSGGHSDRGDSGESGDEDVNDILAQFGKTTQDLPSDLKGLSGASLTAYLKSTSSGIPAWLARFWPGWRLRIAADPEFPFKVLMEETIGLGLASSGMIAARGKDILSELDFAFCDIAVGATLNFMLVYLLTPAYGASTGGMLSRLPANMFATGAHALPVRLAAFMYKGILFASCGFAGSVVGTSLTQALIGLRRVVSKMRGKDSDYAEKVLPNVLINSSAWAGFMFISSNPRYQLLAGLERALFSLAPEAVAKVGSGVLRTGNNVLGGANWVLWARAIGLQKSAEKNAEETSSNNAPKVE